MLRPVIDGMFHIPTRLLEGRVDLSKLKASLTAKHHNQETNVTTPVPMYRMRGDNVISVPRHYGKTKFPDLWARAVNKTVRRSGGVALPIGIEPRDDEQLDFVNQLMGLYDDPNTTVDAQANAATGSGKTASACMMQAGTGIGPMLVLVRTNRLKSGWLGNKAQGKGLRFFYGDEWVRKNVGIVQQDLCDYRGKQIVIAMAPSLCSRQYPKEFYEYFSVVVVDELHEFATPVLNQVLGMFPAYARIGLTATPREGEMAKVINAHLGEPVIVSTQEVLKPIVCRIQLEQRFDFRDRNGDPIDNKNSIITFMSKNRARQALLADITYYRGYVRGRHCLVISDRTDQLLDLRNRLEELGVPANDIGLYVGAHKTGKIKLTGKIVAGDNVIHFRALPGFNTRKDAERYVTRQARSLAGRSQLRLSDVEITAKYAPELHEPSEADYEWIEQHCRIVLATFGVFKSGIDIKRLDWGLEGSPRGDVAQPVGRVLRLMKGKPCPEWYSIYDKLWTIEQREIMGNVATRRYEHKTPKKLENSRRKSYDKQNATRVWIDKPYEAIEAAKALAA